MRLGCLVLLVAALHSLLEASPAPRKLGDLLRPGAVLLSELGLEPIEHLPC